MNIPLTLNSILLLFLLGIFVGIIGSVLGIGGGIFVVPFLIFFLKVPIKYAIAVSLVSIVAVSSSVAMVNIEKRLTNIRLGLTLEMTMALGSIFGSLIMLRLSSNQLQLYFGIILFAIALQMLLKSFKKNRTHFQNYGSFFYFDPLLQKNVYYDVKKTPIAMIFSFFGGTLSGLFGLGGGIIQVPIMNLICGVPIKVATSTSNFMIGLSASISAIILYRNGYVIENITVILIFGIILGSYLGIKFLYKAKNEFIQFFFAIFTFFVSIKTIMESLTI